MASSAVGSNYGACVDLFAPGNGIVSAIHTPDTATTAKSGTSMAAPHVAGVAALMLEATPSALPAAVNAAIINGATLNKITNAGPGSPNRLLYSRAAPPVAVGGTPPPPPPPPGGTPQFMTSLSGSVAATGDALNLGFGSSGVTGTYTVSNLYGGAVFIEAGVAITSGHAHATTYLDPDPPADSVRVDQQVWTPVAWADLPAYRGIISSVTLAADEQLVATASGTWDVCGGACPSSADGLSHTKSDSLAPNLPLGSLVGSLDSGATWFKVGAEARATFEHGISKDWAADRFAGGIGPLFRPFEMLGDAFLDVIRPVHRVWFASDACDRRHRRWAEGSLRAAVRNAYAIHTAMRNEIPWAGIGGDDPQDERPTLLTP